MPDAQGTTDGIPHCRELLISVIGIPVQQPKMKARAFIPKGGMRPIAQMYSPKKADAWRSIIYSEAVKVRPSMPIQGPIHAEILFRMPRPQYLQTKKAWLEYDRLHDKKPDRDNLEKALCDALKDAGIMNDDCQIASGPITKRYVNKDESPGAEILIRWWPE